MANQDKRKTKTIILRELESIKGLLDDDDIPLLQEVIHSAQEVIGSTGIDSTEIDNTEEETDSYEALDDDDLAELQQAYRDLLQARGIDPDWPETDPEPPILDEIEAQPRKASLPENSPAKAPATSPASTEKPGTLAKEPREEVQTSLFDTNNEPSESTPAVTRRNGVTKASGENPFLPAHIRERLHGNRPPPLFESFAGTGKNKAQLTPDRMQLVEEVVNSLLPQVRTRLRDFLLEMDAEQLREFLNDDSPSPKPD